MVRVRDQREDKQNRKQTTDREKTEKQLKLNKDEFTLE